LTDRSLLVLPPLVRLSRRLTLGLFAVIVAESAAGSSGRWLMVGPVSIRTVLLLACLAVSTPLLSRELHHLRSQGMFWVTAAFLCTLVLSALWAHQRGNATPFIVNDLTTFSALLLVPTVIALRPTRTEVEGLLAVLLCASVALAGFTLVVHLLVPLNAIDVNALNAWLNSQSLGAMADVGNGLIRLYLRSQILFVPALLFGIVKVARGGRHRFAYLAASSLVAMGLLLSLTRSLWIGMIIALAVLCAWSVRATPKLARSTGLVLAGLAGLIVVSMVAYRGPALVSAAAERLDPRLVVLLPSNVNDTPTGGIGGSAAPTTASTMGTAPRPTASTARPPNPAQTLPSTYSPTSAPTSDGQILESDADAVRLRNQTLALHTERIRERPFTGWGLGYNLDAIRHDGRTEFMYWDLLMKLGIPGFLVFIALYAWTPVRLRLRRTRGSLLDAVSTSSPPLVASLAGVAVTSYFDPFLNSTLGIVILLLLVASASAEATPAATGSTSGAVTQPGGGGPELGASGITRTSSCGWKSTMSHALLRPGHGSG
jgi:hypothetical protein